MAPISVKVSHAKTLHRFVLKPSSNRAPSFLTLCDAIVYHLEIPLSAARLADQKRSPFQLWFLDDEYDYIRLYDDHSLREALRIFPRLLRIKIRSVPTNTASKHSKGSAKGSKKSSDDVPSLSMEELLTFLHHVRNNANPTVAALVTNAYNTAVRSPEDLRALAKSKGTLSMLFSTFLYHIALAGGPVSAELCTQMVSALEKILASAQVSVPTATAALRAAKGVCGCAWAGELLRNKYVLMVEPEGVSSASVVKAAVAAEKAKVRPVKHYKTHFKKMLKEGGKVVADAYCVLRQQAGGGWAASGRQFKLTRRLCKGLERAAFHFVRCHVSEGGLAFEKRALKSLSSSVCRKLARAGMDERLVDYVTLLVGAFAKDPNVLQLVVRWSNRPARAAADLTTEESSRDLPEFAADGDTSSSEDRDDMEGGGELGPRRFSRLRSKSPILKRRVSKSPAPKHRVSKSPARRRRASKSPTPRRKGTKSSLWKRTGSRLSSSSSSSSSDRGRGRPRQERDNRNEQSLQSAGAWRAGSRRDRSRRRDEEGEDSDSLVESSEDREEDEKRMYREKEHPDWGDSSDTRESKWGRVLQTQENEAKLARDEQLEFDRWKQMERERNMDIQLALLSERDKALEMSNSMGDIHARRRYSRPSNRRPSGSGKGRRKHAKGSRSHRRPLERQQRMSFGTPGRFLERARSGRDGFESDGSLKRGPAEGGSLSTARKFQLFQGRQKDRKNEHGGPEDLFI